METKKDSMSSEIVGMIDDHASKMSEPRITSLAERPFYLFKHAATKLVARHITTAVCALAVFITCVVLLNWEAVNQPPGDDATCDLRNTNGTQLRFSVNHRFGGDLSYIQARAIQIIWDLVVGQGGRVLHGWIFMATMADVLVLLLERSGAPAHLYVSLGIKSSEYGAAKSLGKVLYNNRKGWKLQVTALWALLGLVYVAFFPIIWSAAVSTRLSHRLSEHAVG